MGNFLCSRRNHGGGRRSHPPLPENQPPLPEIMANRYVFAAATPYPSRYPNPNSPSQYYPYPGYYPHAPPANHVPLHPTDGDSRHQGAGAPQSSDQVQNWTGGRCPYGPVVLPYVEHQKAVTIRNDINIKKEAFRIERDECNPTEFLIAFTFDATVPGCLTIIFFAKEGENCNLYPTKSEELIKPIRVKFEEGLGQKFRQPCGTGIDLSKWDEAELVKGEEVSPVAVKAEARVAEEGDDHTKPMNSQITQAVFEKEKDGYRVRVVKQILRVSGMRYELQEIYGIGNSMDTDIDEGKECAICLSEPRDTTILPCRHMCMCSGCAKVLRYQTNRCPICRNPVERFLEIRVNK